MDDNLNKMKKIVMFPFVFFFSNKYTEKQKMWVFAILFAIVFSIIDSLREKKDGGNNDEYVSKTTCKECHNRFEGKGYFWAFGNATMSTSGQADYCSATCATKHHYKSY
jgi:hypothetical protein